MGDQVEHRIRDRLAKSLDVLEPGLAFVEKEKYLPNELGTRGFVDIVARDAAGKWVLIELKRSGSASREALHEVLKYVEGVKANISVREDEIRVMVVSTEWDELLVPFSSFVTRVNCAVAGYQLEVDAQLNPIAAHKVEPISVRGDRLFAPWHELNMYEDAEGLARAVDSYETACREKCVGDFVLVELCAHPDRRQREIAGMVAAYQDLKQRGKLGDPPSVEEIERRLPDYRHVLYFAPLMLSDEQCMQAIERLGEAEDVAEFREYIRDMEGDERTCTLHEKIYEIGPKVHRDHFEIGYPAKFGGTLLDDEGWTIERIRRYGTIAANALLTDEVIERELRGETGVTGQKYKRTVALENVSEVASLKGEIQQCFDHNQQLAHQLAYCIDDAIRQAGGTRLQVDVFNPSAITLSLFKAATDEEGMRYVPHCILAVLGADAKPRVIYSVTLEPNGKRPSAQRLIDRFYGGDPFALLSNLQWGGYEFRDADICEDIGLAYAITRLDCETGRAERLNNFRWVQSEFHGSFDGFYGFMLSHQEFVGDLINLYGNHWNGFMVFHGRDTVVEFAT